MTSEPPDARPAAGDGTAEPPAAGDGTAEPPAAGDGTAEPPAAGDAAPNPFTHPDLGVPGSFAPLPPPDGAPAGGTPGTDRPARTARGDVDRLARSDAARQARNTERAERTGRGDPDRPPRIRSSGRSSRAPQRVRVTSSRMTATARAPIRTVSREIDEQTGVGEVYLRSLLRAQLRLGLSVIAVLVLALGTLPLTFALIPRLGSVRVLTVPLPWLLVGVSVYPLLFGVAWWHVLAAERAERDFAAIVESD